MGEEECEYDDQGRFYFDHDPTYFNLVLNFMRSGDCIIPYERGAFEALKKDCAYWRLDTLEARVSTRDYRYFIKRRERERERERARARDREY